MNVEQTCWSFFVSCLHSLLVLGRRNSWTKYCTLSTHTEEAGAMCGHALFTLWEKWWSEPNRSTQISLCVNCLSSHQQCQILLLIHNGCKVQHWNTNHRSTCLWFLSCNPERALYFIYTDIIFSSIIYTYIVTVNVERTVCIGSVLAVLPPVGCTFGCILGDWWCCQTLTGGYPY